MIGTEQMNFGSFGRLMRTYWRRWLVPAVLVSVAAAIYAYTKPDVWEAEQALIVRNDALGRESAPGKFRQPEEMKTLLETTLELVRGRGVLAGALAMVGPADEDNDAGNATWPTDEAIEKLRRNVKLTPPKGAEFGKTEVFYLEVRDQSRDRALALCRAMIDQLQTRAKALRNDRAESVIAELLRSVALAREDLAEATARLSALEAAMGGDLAELKAMGEGNAGDSALRRTATEIRAELRATESQLKANEELLALLTEARDHPQEDFAIPQRLLDAQPTLRQLHSGLIDARLNAARLAGRMEANHPLLIAADEAREAVEQQMRDELSAAIRAMTIEQSLAQERQAMLTDRLAAVNTRLDRLAELRADYLNLQAEVNNRKNTLERNEQQLAEARAAKAGAEAASLIAAIDEPDAGTRPVGPSRPVLAAAGVAAGLLCGLGLLCFSLPAAAATQPLDSSAGESAKRNATAPRSKAAAPALSLETQPDEPPAQSPVDSFVDQPETEPAGLGGRLPIEALPTAAAAPADVRF